MIELDWTMPIDVSDHARKRCREWLGWDDPQDIRGEVRSAILEGRVSDHLPNWTGRRHNENRVGYRYLWNPEATRCWIVYARVDEIFVATIALERSLQTEITDGRRLRTGMTGRP
jgi:hypothetical protein